MVEGTSGAVTAALVGLDGRLVQSVTPLRLPGLASGAVLVRTTLAAAGRGTVTVTVRSLTDGRTASATATVQSPVVVAPPVLVAFEAKNESIVGGLGQCVVAMVGTQRFNTRLGAPADPIYGCVTTGTAWRFLRLSATTVTLGLREYTIAEVDTLLGILVYMVGPPPAATAA